MIENKFTIVIPVRNRAHTIKHTILTCLEQNYRNVEIVISDNQSKDNLLGVLSEINDNRIRYFRTPKLLSMSESFDYGLDKVEGDCIVCMLGADDGLVNGSLKLVNEIINKYKVSAVSSTQAVYVWPCLQSITGRSQILFGNSSEKLELRETKKYLQQSAYYFENYCFDLPNLYCGFVKKEVIDECKKEGKFFNGCTPDAYSAVVIAGAIEKYIFCNFPLVIAGASSASNGASGFLTEVNNATVDEYYQLNTTTLANGFEHCIGYTIQLGESLVRAKELYPDLFGWLNIDKKFMLKKELLEMASSEKEKTRKILYKISNNLSVSLEISFFDHVKFSLLKIKKIIRLIVRSLFNNRYSSFDNSNLEVINIYQASIIIGILGKHSNVMLIGTSFDRVLKLSKNYLSKILDIF